MSIVAVVGDCTTTTALALASGWPREREVVVVEADRTGGSLAAWLDTPATPSLSTVVASSASLGNSASTAWFAIDAMVRQADSGTRFIAAPTRAREANRAIIEADTTLFPLLARIAEPTIIADLGRHSVVDSPPAVLSLAASIVVCHRQDTASAGAATVLLERLAELVESLTTFGTPVTVALIGGRPFGSDEVGEFLDSTVHTHVAVHELPIDHLTAAVFAGRTGVSERRLARLPLIRDAANLAAQLALDTPTATNGWIDQLGAPT